MGASRPTVSRVLKMECGCLYQYSPDRFVRGEREFTCAHGRRWRITAVMSVTSYISKDATPVEADNDG